MYRLLTNAEISQLESQHCSAEDWSTISIHSELNLKYVHGVRFSGTCRLGKFEKSFLMPGGMRKHSGIFHATLHNVSVGNDCCIENIKNYIANYDIEEDCFIENCDIILVDGKTSFGCGVEVSVLCETGGREVAIHDGLTAHEAYITAMYRHRPMLIQRMKDMVAAHTAKRTSDRGTIAAHSTVVDTGYIKNVYIGPGAKIEGAGRLKNGSLMSRTDSPIHIGYGVIADDFIVQDGSSIEDGTSLTRCFVGQACTFKHGYSASDSLFFCNCHEENGEACSIFAGPFTVTHHKSTLLIAGMFSFMNAGSGSNQSNHLFKSGAVHQAVHLRGCKFASGSYIMAPATEGAFTMVMGHHSRHHDTSAFPYSYLLEKEDRSYLLPAVNLTSYGTVRDLEKWPARDRRRVMRDIINFETHNPYTCWSMLRAVEMLHSIEDQNPDSPVYSYNRVQIRAAALQRGLTLYNRAIVGALGAMLERGSSVEHYNGAGRWVDMAGQYITKRAVEELIEAIEEGCITTTEAIDNYLRVFAVHYDDYAHSWAEQVYASLLGHYPDTAEIREAIEAGANAREKIRLQTEHDRARDFALDMAVGYGIDSDTGEERMADFRSVRGV